MTILGLTENKAITLSLNNLPSISINKNGKFTFPTSLPSGSNYSISILTQPDELQCSILKGSGAISTTDISNITIGCTPTQPTLALLAGAIGGPGLADGKGRDARLLSPSYATMSRTGSIFLRDSTLLRKITSDGQVSYYTGSQYPLDSLDCTLPPPPTGMNIPSGAPLKGMAPFTYHYQSLTSRLKESDTTAAYCGSPINGRGIAAQLAAWGSLVVDSKDNVYITDAYSNAIRRVSSDGSVTTYAGSITQSGNTDGSAATARFSSIGNLHIDSNDNIYLENANWSLNVSQMRKISPSGETSTLNLKLDRNYYLADEDGTFYSFQFNSKDVYKFDKNGNSNLFIKSNTDPTSPQSSFRFTHVKNGIFYGIEHIDSTVNTSSLASRSRILKLDLNGNLTILAGSDAHWPPTTSDLNFPDGKNGIAQLGEIKIIAIANGEIYFTDYSAGRIRKLDASGNIVTIAGSTIASGSQNGPGISARFMKASGATYDSNGNAYISDTDDHTIRKITPDGIVSVFAGKAGVSGAADGEISQALLNSPGKIVADQFDNLYFIDAAPINSNLPITYQGDAIRKISPSGSVSTLLKGKICTPEQSKCEYDIFSTIEIAKDGTLFLGGISYRPYTSNTQPSLTVLKLSPQGNSSTLFKNNSLGYENGSLSTAKFRSIVSLAIGSNGTLFVADASNNVIRKILPDGQVYTHAGNGPFRQDYLGNSLLRPIQDGQGLNAIFTGITSMKMDATGTLFVSDRGSIRKISPDGLVSTIAGNKDTIGTILGKLPASLATIQDIAISPLGQLLIVSEGSILTISGLAVKPK
ncbi:hypothetical protein KSF73_05220 [Burkholderiaceae bacterium DAT-1]|nr:hypothetical protein [Burkholderiaceae bacterium DAT-1]